MKFRIKFNTQTSSKTFDDIAEDSSIKDLKDQIKKQFLSLKKSSNFHLSLNGKDSLDESQTIAHTGLVNGDIIYLLNEINKETISSLDQPLTLDEVRDSHTYPVLIHRLLEYAQPDNDFDSIVLILHALMLECGFQMTSGNNNDWKSAGKCSTRYVLSYRLKLCDEERSRCSLLIAKNDSTVTTNGIVSSIAKPWGDFSFNMTEYLHTQKEVTALNAVFPYRNVRELSRLFKDNVANRLLCKMLEESGQRSSATLSDLPNEIKLRLAKYLPIRTLLKLQSTCRDIHNTLHDNLLWHDLCLRDFDKTVLVSISESNSGGTDWRESYKFMYAQKQATLRHQSKSSTFFHTPYLPLAPPVHPTHRMLFPDPTNGAASAGFHPFPPTIYRPIPPGIFRICSANTHQTQTPPPPQQTQHHLYCQPFFGLKWVVIFAAAMIPLQPYFHPIWLG